MRSPRATLANDRCWLDPALAVATGAALIAALPRPAWVFMWMLALVIFAGFKYLSCCEAQAGGLAAPRITRFLYLFCWPGMSFKEFARIPTARRQPNSIPPWIAAATKTLIGAALVWFAVPMISAEAWLKRVFAWGMLVVPLGWLFPPVFVRHVMLPMLQAIGATGNRL